MKNLIKIAMVLVFGSGAFASGSFFQGMSEKELDNYEITVTDKRTGKTIGKMSRAKYKVVKIDSGSVSDAEMVVLVDQLRQRVKQDEAVISKYDNGYNTVILHGGYGKNGLNKEYNNGNWDVEEKRSAVFGATYCRSEGGLGICGSGFTNSSGFLGLKFDW